MDKKLYSFTLNGVATHEDKGQIVSFTVYDRPQGEPKFMPNGRKMNQLFWLYNLLRDAVQAGYYHPGRRSHFHRRFVSVNFQIQKNTKWYNSGIPDYSRIILTDGDYRFNIERTANRFHWDPNSLPGDFSMDNTLVHVVCLNPIEQLASYGRCHVKDKGFTFDFRQPLLANENKLPADDARSDDARSDDARLYIYTFITDGELRSTNTVEAISHKVALDLSSNDDEFNRDPLQHIISPSNDARYKARKRAGQCADAGGARIPLLFQLRKRGCFSSLDRPWSALPKRPDMLAINEQKISFAPSRQPRRVQSESAPAPLGSRSQDINLWIKDLKDRKNVVNALRTSGQKEHTRRGWPNRALLRCLALLGVYRLAELDSIARHSDVKPFKQLIERIEEAMESPLSDLSQEANELRLFILTRFKGALLARDRSQTWVTQPRKTAFLNCPPRLAQCKNAHPYYAPRLDSRWHYGLYSTLFSKHVFKLPYKTSKQGSHIYHTDSSTSFRSSLSMNTRLTHRTPRTLRRQVLSHRSLPPLCYSPHYAFNGLSYNAWLAHVLALDGTQKDPPKNKSRGDPDSALFCLLLHGGGLVVGSGG